MLGINNLEVLLKSMQPELVQGEFVFCTVEEPISVAGIWSLITLNVHSDLEVVGFLAALTPKLAAEGISVNVVSAFYHDHLFVPASKKDQALAILKSVS